MDNEQQIHRIERPKIDAILKPRAIRQLAKDRRVDLDYRLSLERDLSQGWTPPEGQ